MATPLEDIEKFEAGSARIRAAAPALSTLQRPMATPAARPSAPPAQSAGTALGSAVRRVAPVAGAVVRDIANTPLRNTEVALNVGTAIPRAIGGFARDVAGGVTGQPSPDEGQPLGPITLPRLGRPSPAPAVPGAGGGVRPANWSPGPSARPTPRPAAAAPAGAPAPAAPTPALTRDPSAFNLQPGDTNTFTGSDGVTRAVPGLLNAGGSMAAAVQAAAPAPVATLRGPSYAPRGRQGAVIENPGDSTVDKLQRALGSYSLKGSPSSRAAVAQAILGEERDRNAERASALATGDAADLAAINNDAQAQQSFLQRRLAADQFNVQTQEARAERANDRAQRAADRTPNTVTGADGTVNVVRADGSFTPVTDAAGATLRAPMAPRQTGELTQGERLKSYTDRYNAIMGDVTSEPAAKRQALSDLDADPLYQGLRGGQPPVSTPSLQQFLDAARQQNPNVSDADLTAYYQQTYGG